MPTYSRRALLDADSSELLLADGERVEVPSIPQRRRRPLLDADGERLCIEAGVIAVLPERMTLAEAVPAAPAGARLAAGTLTWKESGPSFRYSVFRGDDVRSARERVASGIEGTIYEAVAPGADEHLSYQVSAYDDYTGEEGPRSRPVFQSGKNRK